MNQTPSSATDRITRALADLDQFGQRNAWIHVAEHSKLMQAAAQVDAAVANGEDLPLAGMVIAVKDNIDVAGMPTTCASPGATYTPDQDATSVRLLRAAGAVILGKTNMDQFATGLVGVRSPHGIPVSVLDPELVSGGSSSGSAVAVAQGIVDAALGTDTAGSGRVPAAFNAIVGIKPTLGLVSTSGVVPASPSYDAVTVFATDLSTAELVLAQIAHPDPADPRSRRWDSRAPLAAPAAPVYGVPTAQALGPMSASWRSAFESSVTALTDAGMRVVEVDIAPLLDSAKLLYDGALIAERTAAFGALLDREPHTVDPTVAGIVRTGEGKSAVELANNQFELARVRALLGEVWSEIDALVLPTAPGHPSVAEVQADPVAVNSWVGTYTNFVNLLDLSAVAVPGIAPVGVTLIGPAFADRALLDLALHVQHVCAGRPSSSGGATGHPLTWLPENASIAVLGAHLTGQPLNHQLTSRGARLLGEVTTAATYSLYALNTVPPKPGLVRNTDSGTSFIGEEWAIPVARLAEFLGDVARPMCVGQVELSDGRQVLGFLCEPHALDSAQNISDFRGWAEYTSFSPVR